MSPTLPPSMRAAFPPALAVALATLACFPRAAPHPRAVESGYLCAAALAKGDLQTAEDQCDLCLQFSPDFGDCWTNKGLIAWKRGQPAKAKELLITALRKNQDQAQAYNGLGIIYLDELAFGKAHDNFQRALRVNPDYLEARYNLGLAWKGLKEPQKARKEFRTILQINDGLAKAWAQLGQLDLDDGDAQAAVEHLARATRLAPDYTDAWMVLGNAYLAAGQPCEGKDAYASCIELDEHQAACRNDIAVAQGRCALQERALEDARGKAAAAKTAEAEYALALKARERGLSNDEERAYKRCLKYDDRFVRCHWGLFELYRGRADERLARIACQNVLKFAGKAEFPRQVQDCEQYVNN